MLNADISLIYFCCVVYSTSFIPARRIVHIIEVSYYYYYSETSFFTWRPSFFSKIILDTTEMLFHFKKKKYYLLWNHESCLSLWEPACSLSISTILNILTWITLFLVIQKTTFVQRKQSKLPTVVIILNISWNNIRTTTSMEEQRQTDGRFNYIKQIPHSLCLGYEWISM